jgi:hypothetical protein
MKKTIIILALSLFSLGTFTSCMDEEVVPIDNYGVGSTDDNTDDGI